MEFYLLNYFKAGLGPQDGNTLHGRLLFALAAIAVTFRTCESRGIAEWPTSKPAFAPQRGIFNRLFATATPLFTAVSDGTPFPAVKKPNGAPFLVRNIYTDLKRHDLG